MEIFLTEPLFYYFTIDDRKALAVSIITTYFNNYSHTYSIGK